MQTAKLAATAISDTPTTMKRECAVRSSSFS
jgi:hypothetical protein